MGTRSTITIKNGEEYKKVYCHWDGYLSHNGKILLEHYTTPEKIDALVSNGDMSVLAKAIGEKHPFDEMNPDMCTFYHRDRQEEWEEVKPVVVSVYEELGFESYNYLFQDGKWYWFTGANIEEMKELTKEECEEKNKN